MTQRWCKDNDFSLKWMSFCHKPVAFFRFMASFARVVWAKAEPSHTENGIFSHARWCGVGEDRTFAYRERVIFLHARTFV